MTRFTKLAEICERYQLDALYVFGSRAQEVQQWLLGCQDDLPSSASDVDIGVKPRRGISFAVRDKVRLQTALEEFFDVSRVDLVFLNEADPFLAANVIRGERLFAQDDYWAAEYELYVLRRAGDLAPLERERIALVLGRRL